MKNLILTTMTTLIMINAIQADEKMETKQQKIEQLFELTHKKEMFEPIFANSNITDTKIRQEAIDRYFVIIKDNYKKTYDKFFSEEDINEMIRYHSSATGKRYMEKSMELATEMQKTYGSIMSIIQEALAMQDKAAGILKSTAVIHFDELAKDKSDDEIRELFNKEVQHDGLTIVKFSTILCGPCKVYAPIFDEVASELKELIIDDKKIAVKYIAIDASVTRVIAQDCSILSVPATLFYKNGKQVDSKVGSIKKDTLISQIKQLAK